MPGRENGGVPIFFYDRMLQRPSNTVRIYQQDTDKTPELIVTGFYRDDFHMSITNQWATGDSTMVKQVVDSVAGMITGRGAQMFGHLANEIVDAVGVRNTAIPGTGGKYKVDDVMKQIDKSVHAHYFTADDFYKNFKGTTVTYPTNIQVTLVSDEWEPKEDIFQQLRKIIDVSIGEYQGLGLEINGEDYDFIGIQHAPNGFRSGSYNLRDPIKGSLKIIYGDPLKGGVVVGNMLISNVHFTFSKAKVEIRKGEFRPLYIDVQIMLEPGKKFTKQEVYQTLGTSFLSRTTDETKIVPTGESKEESKRIKVENRVRTYPQSTDWWDNMPDLPPTQ